MKTLEEKRKYRREYMREYNKTSHGKLYNQTHSRKWRIKNKKPRNKNRGQRTTEYRAILVDFLLKRDGMNCGFCKEPLAGLQVHIDHTIPLALGGSNTMENIRLAHAKCNYSSGVRIRRQKQGY